MVKITAIEAIPTTIGYHHAIEASSGVLRAAEHVLIRVRTDEGVVGVGEAASRSFVYGESQESIVAAVKKWIEPALVGADPFAVNVHQQDLAWLAGNNTARGATDIALHDLRGKLLGIPSWRLLGGMKRDIPVTRILSMGSPEEVAVEARDARSQWGITSFKVKVGTGIDADVERVASVRRAVGDDAYIYVDANHGYTAESAIALMGELGAVGVNLVEEPSPAEDRIGRRRFAVHTAATIMADESAPDLNSTVREILDGEARAISVKTTRTGFTESTQVVAAAVALGARTLIGSQADGMIGAAAALAFASAFPSLAREPAELEYYSTLTDTLTVHPLVVRAGTLTPSDAPGIGVEIDELKLRRYRID
ncbi:enolase [Microbacterium sp. ISL-103]|uniref:mandelate racemase/muconate lactonizing enzyme family protein n=1 Tax=Microbacterium sp. ISL-103 TaxID=2819156 RepID=UPI001BE6A4AE|nr:enolase C-terminal domain-like protein [Microbacterium sp. ISL-103]MBT2473650.1 enolase [Microbacterium sp. ISL-103]